jgi:hypothetical protein
MEGKILCRDIVLSLIDEFSIKKKYGSNEFVDYCKIVSEKIFNDFRINIIRVVNQNGGALCGFHCLFNIIHYLDFLGSKKLEEKFVSLKKMNSPVKFWKFYKNTLNFLVNNMKMEENARQCLLNEGPLERYQFKFLLDKCNKTKESKYLKFLRFFFGFGIVQGMHKSEIKSLQQHFDKLNECKNMTYVILLGITNHWVI